MSEPTHAPSEWKPAGYPVLSPYLIVDDAAGTIRFLQTAFGAEELRRHEEDEGGIRHAELRLGDSVLMLADSTPDWPPVPAMVHLYVPDVDAAFRKALEAGATPIQEPARRGDEDRRGGVEGPGGTSWWIATREG